jgi:hypothetical protein
VEIRNNYCGSPRISMDYHTYIYMIVLHEIFFDLAAKTVNHKREMILDFRITILGLRWTKTSTIGRGVKNTIGANSNFIFQKIIDYKRLQTKMYINISYLLKNRYKRYKCNCV